MIVVESVDLGSIFWNTWEQRKLNEVISRFIVPMRDKPKSFDGNIRGLVLKI